MGTSRLVMRIVSASVVIAEHAGSIIRHIASEGKLGILEKGVNDLQTEADRRAQRFITASLSKRFSKIHIIGEETLTPLEQVADNWLELGFAEDILAKNCPQNLLSTKEEDVVIWVDPLDGTAEYAYGFLDHVTVLIGVAIRGKPIAGVIHQPYYNYKVPGAILGRTVWGVVGLGAFGMEKYSIHSDKRIVTTSRLRRSKTNTEAIEALKPDDVIYAGGCGHKTMLVIEGAASAYVYGNPGCKKWDTCAPEAVLRSLGGQMTDLHGNKFQYHKDVQRENTGGVLATVSNHKWCLSRIPQCVKDVLPTEG
ncbi:PREDICTED: 3'(2'),5'-bisphosphate nucleotidase 1-like isoform X1 [Priapulus caudatus]|uniref:3'(2'),5'-bisphosphate nucleotidase 1 n=1 Tax=Priapulus caudatus TaxID=37621 RepID=A0ABM1FA41_PRICU|nr:PREDICTED: 3'(2'),5'-bisphosphate nucleotidase 1-like isoform X1 [Priapulus caudatus]